MEAVCETQLSAAEKQQVQQYVARDLPAKQEDYAHGYAYVQQSMKSLTGKDPYTTGKDPEDGTNIYNKATMREWWRLQFARQKNDPEADIVERHDPTVAARYDSDHLPTDLVTDMSLHYLYEAAKWVGIRGGLPAPAPNFIATERQLIRQNWNSYSPALQTAYAHIGRNIAASSINMSDIEPEKVKSFVRVSMDPAKVNGGPAAAAAGPAALPAMLAQVYYDYLVKNHRTLGMSTQEEILWTHLWNNQIQQVQRDTAHTLFGDAPSAH